MRVRFFLFAEALKGERKMRKILLCPIFAPTAYLEHFRMHQKKPAFQLNEIAGFILYGRRFFIEFQYYYIVVYASIEKYNVGHFCWYINKKQKRSPLKFASPESVNKRAAGRAIARPPVYILPRFNKNENTNLVIHCQRRS